MRGQRLARPAVDPVAPSTGLSPTAATAAAGTWEAADGSGP